MKERKFLLYSIALIVLIEIIALIGGRTGIAYHNLLILGALIVIYLLQRKMYIPFAPVVGIALIGVFNYISDYIIINDVKLYNYSMGFLRTDMIVHLLVAFSVTIIIYHILYHQFKTKKITLIILSVLGTLGLGTLNEIFELVGIIIFKTPLAADYYNNAIDLVSNLIGALTASVYIYWKKA